MHFRSIRPELYFLKIMEFSHYNEHGVLSLLLVFIATIWPTCTSVNGSNSGNTSSRSLSVAMLASVVEGLGFFAGLDAVVCGFPRRGPKYPFGNIGGR